MVSFEQHDDECCQQYHTEGAQGSSSGNVSSEQMSNELVTCREKLAKTEEQMRYLAADFDNFRRNVTKERAHWARGAQIKIFEELVGIVDDFSRAIADFQKMSAISDAERARFVGLELVYKNISKLFETHGVTEIPTNVPFNPELHEALMQVAAEGKVPGSIVDVVQKGYMMKDVVIRPAKVSVAQ